MKNIQEDRLIWLDGKIVPLHEATINVLSPTSQFGANVFEGIRCYWNEEEGQLYAFRLAEHYKRLKNSMKIFQMEDKYPIDLLKQSLIDVVKANNYKEDIAVRQTVFIDGLGSWSSKGPVNMFVAPIAKHRSDLTMNKGMRCCVSSWERISDRNISPKVKVGANYINSRMAQIEALNNGYDSAIFMNNQGKVSEGPGSCIFIVRDGKLLTPPITASILESITRDTVLELAKEYLKIEVAERDIDRTELYVCDEIFLCGSAIEIAPVTNVDGIDISCAKPGDLTKAIHKIYIKAVTGKISAYKRWLTSIYA
ncbi:MAG: branched-chain amino acid transaminase [Firmicutes bacterium]|nr:branched-chain amino acid transaminase [Bacillota bacterium]